MFNQTNTINTDKQVDDFIIEHFIKDYSEVVAQCTDKIIQLLHTYGVAWNDLYKEVPSTSTKPEYGIKVCHNAVEYTQVAEDIVLQVVDKMAGMLSDE